MGRRMRAGMYGESLHEETINAIQRLQDIHYPLPGQ